MEEEHGLDKNEITEASTRDRYVAGAMGFGSIAMDEPDARQAEMMKGNDRTDNSPDDMAIDNAGGVHTSGQSMAPTQNHGTPDPIV